MGSTPIAFADRIAGLLQTLQPPRTQRWLAEESGLSTATISRLLSGRRHADVATIESLAPVLGVDPASLVRGTDAEARVAEASEWVRRREYEVAVERVRTLEAELRQSRTDLQLRDSELEVERRHRSDAEAQVHESMMKLSELQRECEIARQDKEVLGRAMTDFQSDLLRHRSALDLAANKIEELRGIIERLEGKLEELGRTSMATKVLAGVAAFTGVVTAATLLSASSPAEQKEEHEDD